MSENMEKRAGQYVAVRDKIREIEARHEAELKGPKEMLAKLGGVIQKFLDDNKLESLKTSAGTCYKSIRWTASLKDADAFMRHVIETEQFDLIERRASATAVHDYVQTHKMLPPGVSLNALESIGVRRPDSSKS